MAQQTAAEGRHDLILEGRGRLSATGVTKIVSCDEYGAVLETVQGTLTVTGREITVETLSVDTGEVRLQGTVTELSYADSRAVGSRLRRLFG